MRKIFSFVSLGLAISLLAAAVQAKGHLRIPNPVSDNDYYPTASAAKVELGKVLFFDKIISGYQL